MSDLLIPAGWHAPSGIVAGCTTRLGGVSNGVYESLNLGGHVGDNSRAVVENRKRFRTLCDLPAEPLWLNQVHGCNIVRDPAVGAEADAAYTSLSDNVCVVMVADCLPVLFASADGTEIAAAHAGWRGAVAGVLAETVAAMEKLGARRGEICAAVGPTIHQPAYEVGPEFEAQFVAQAPENQRFFHRTTTEGRPHFDLPGYCLAQLEAAGIGQVENAGRCTYANESLLYSYRRKTHFSEPDYGRQISAIVLA